jgi:hypothetical protein
MGFQSQFRNQQPQPSQLGNVMVQAQSLAAQNGGAQAVIDQLAQSGAVCTMPSGKQIAVKDILTMSRTMTPQQLLIQLMQA